MKFFTKKKLLLILAIIVFAIALSYHQNNVLTTTKLDVHSSELPESFDGYRIVHLSDLHSKCFGENQKRLVERVKNENPDLIVFTGDIVDQKDINKKPGITLMENMTAITPVYFVTGNHEWWSEEYSSLENDLEAAGVNVLRNSSELIQVNGSSIAILGIDDPARAENPYSEKGIVSETINSLKMRADFSILLSHRPEMFSVYQDHNIDLTFSGHAHGGQFRLPFIGGLIAPDQGLFPNYTAGKYVENGSTMIVSRGLGNSIIPQRIFNRPEIVSVTLHANGQ
ncbi:metallophosphoesterase [Virgibacillus sp. JSM 102003]|uniref:metallophosphoesterase n=1 Tax=Virgibacillus sp. JSM 102003 TaxID=1562108 RepID=UPI0035C00E4C